MYFAKLIDMRGRERWFHVLGYHSGKYWVYIDFVYPMQLSKIIYRQDI